MASFEPSNNPEPRLGPQLFVGAASPLWAYFGVAAAGGVTYWLMTRWLRPVNLEAMFGGVAQIAEPLAEPAIEATEVAAELAYEAPALAIELLEGHGGKVEVPPELQAESNPVAETPALSEPGRVRRVSPKPGSNPPARRVEPEA